MLLVGLCN